ncbi:MAG TPA: phosphoribosylamine--glycine ligase [Candidatus Baltobacteraceae bacterium]|jgi:phosphoribosylamine--glycine ligase|nr:phosphoribosylamine--glycine ligase [Candidatus Baltobacteraceae bacterium]
MNILVIGNGTREDALSWLLANSPSCSALFAAPGNAGTASRGENWSEISATDGKTLAERALEKKIDLVVIGPDAAIAAGVADRIRAAGIAVFGPDRSPGRLESSKIFAKRFMERHGIPTARGRAVHSLEAGRKVLSDWEGGCVVKADGLASGKGVVVAADAQAALATVEEWYGPAGIPGGGSGIILERRLIGRELSFFALGDGATLVPWVSACDYKRALDGDRGPNTGGMGSYTPPEGFPRNYVEIIRERILDPVARGLKAEGERYMGALYCGLMWTDDGPMVIEFNARFGDPEMQAIAPRVRGDFAALLAGAAQGRLDPALIDFTDEACVAVVLTTTEYPIRSTPLGGLPSEFALPDKVLSFWGVSRRNGDVVDTAGGRVLTISALGSSLEQARDRAYEAARDIRAKFGVDAVRYRRDIALSVSPPVEKVSSVT